MTEMLKQSVAYDKFVALVREMRHAQKDYFRCRTAGYLRVAKQYEREVDKIIEDFLTEQTGEQMPLC